MKVAELKLKIKDYKAARLRQLVVEMYKAMPKAVKEDASIDALVENPEGGRRKPETEALNVELLRMDVERFLLNAYKQHYCVPNTVVSKRERSKWRFTVIRLFKQLNGAVANSPDTKDAADLLERLYVLLSYSCRYMLFSAYDSFQSTGVGQAEFLQAVLRAKRQVQNPVEFVHDGILLALGHDLNRYTLYEDLMEVFVGHLSTADLKQLAIVACDLIREDVLKNGLPRIHEGQWHDKRHNKYDMEKMLQNLVKMGFFCHMALCDHHEAVNYFRRYNVEKDPEISLYNLLQLIEGHRKDELWVRTYEEGVKNGLRPREEVKRRYDAKRQEMSGSGGTSPEFAIQSLRFE
jgi:hypothetical protein